MVRFIVVSFAFMGLGFYELSGGSDFEPAQWREAKAVKVEEPVAAAPKPEVLTVTTSEVSQAERKSILIAKSSNPAETLVVLASVPTTRRLVGDAQPTPTQQLTKLGPKDIAPALGIDVNKAHYATALLPEKMPDFRRVKGNRVNMRNGPGTQYSVVGKLIRDNEVEVLQDPGAGWVKLQVIETGRIGWMSSKLLEKIES